MTRSESSRGPGRASGWFSVGSGEQETTVVHSADGRTESLVLTVSIQGRKMMTFRIGEDSVTVGRTTPAEVIVDDRTVSREHARIHAGPTPEIEDLGSLNGTKVMGRRLSRGERVPIPSGSVVQLGAVLGFVQDEAFPERQHPSVSDAAALAAQHESANRPARPSPAVLTDPKMTALYELLGRIAPTRLAVLVLGETGVGKDLFANAVHERSGRRGAMVRVNCAALSESLLEAELFGHERGAFTGSVGAKEGLIEAADGGTVFLDELGELSLPIQAKLLRVVEHCEVRRLGSVKPIRVDVRFVAATNRDLEERAASGHFRSDLFYRLNGVSVTIPPLRERPGDIVPLAERFLAAICPSATLSEEVVRTLVSRTWPGNVRELKSAIERAAVIADGGEIRCEHLAATMETPSVPKAAGHGASGAHAVTNECKLRDAVAEVERARILEAMERCRGNQSSAARQLGLSRTTLLKRLSSYGYRRENPTE